MEYRANSNNKEVDNNNITAAVAACRNSRAGFFTKESFCLQEQVPQLGYTAAAS